MSRILNAPIQVTLGPAGDGSGLAPVAFLYRRERHQVQEVMDSWVSAEPWWEDAKAVGRAPAEVEWWRVRTKRGGVFELIQTGTEWRLWKSYD